ncbi:peptidase E [Pseudanabaena sp. FACHB-2040]|uniref:Type 1 glutamine amidotransferase-like domain-containing protein n=1 Tax=Pseudanabaena sp. FACHB-2040 TaxID=2692859 RepID=UPI0016839611|nr:peptidase E [Pseudanabaena sp. FACHB-2040]MBD2257232.1 peptidase E [Pseudanabaena sp. FACHB-2040]
MSEIKRQIVAIGGGGFSKEPDNPLIEQYILNLAAKDKPRVCLVPTAGGDRDSYIVQFYAAFMQFSCTPCHLSLFSPPTVDLRSFVLEQDILYVGGGNTRNLLALWKAWELDQIIKEAWEKGTILCGVSAGSLCWFEEGVSDYLPGQLNPLKCLGFIKGSHSPHYNHPQRRPIYHQLIANSLLSNGYAADDGVALHFVNEQIEKVVSSHLEAKAYRVEKCGDSVTETVLTPTYLGGALE